MNNSSNQILVLNRPSFRFFLGIGGGGLLDDTLLLPKIKAFL